MNINEVLNALIESTNEKILLNYILENSLKTSSNKCINIYYVSPNYSMTEMATMIEATNAINVARYSQTNNPDSFRRGGPMPNNSIVIVTGYPQRKIRWLNNSNDSNTTYRNTKYTLVEATKTTNTEDDYWKKVEDKDTNLIIKLNEYSYFFVTNQILFLFPVSRSLYGSNVYNKEQDPLEKAVLLFRCIMTKQFASVTELQRLSSLDSRALLKEYEDQQVLVMLDKATESVRNEIDDKIRYSNRKLTEYQEYYNEELKNLEKLQLSLLIDYKTKVGGIQNKLTQELNNNPLIKQVSMGVDEYYKRLYIYAKTDYIPQNFIDMEKLKLIKTSFINEKFARNSDRSSYTEYTREKFTEHLDNLINFKERLILAPTTIKFSINLQSLLTKPISIFFYKNEVYEYPCQNRHTYYGSEDTEDNYFEGCRGGFKTIIDDTVKRIDEDPNMIKKLVVITIQYLQTTNPIDYAGQCNLLKGQYEEITD